jgi:transposase, IS5 family
VNLRQSYARVGKLALIKHQRYAHAHQFKRANRSLRKLKTYLGPVIRDIERRIVGNEDLWEACVRPLFLARRVLEQERRQRGHKVYSLHAPEVECIGKGKAHRPYEFGVKVSVATTVKHSAGGQFVTHAAALPGNPYDGHTLATVIPQMQALIGNILHRCITDAGYRGHNAPPDHKFKVYTSGQQIKREFKRRAAIEPVIGHLKEHHRMGRNYLAHASGDAINAVLATAGYNFRRLLAWLRLLLPRILIAFSLTTQLKSA